MLIKNAWIYGESFSPQRGDLAVLHGKIAAIGESLEPQDWGEVLDAQGARLLPGFIDIHIHGGGGCEVNDAEASSLDTISHRLACCGVTSFCPTTMSASPEILEKSFRAVGAYMGHERGAYIHGVHMEGPYVAYAKRGAQDPLSLRLPSPEEVHRLQELAPLAILSMAPELSGALELASEICGSSCAAFAHSEASYEQAQAGISAGFRHAAHLFCAMPPVHHRAPGLAGAVLEDSRVTAELICDGVHLHPAAVRLALRLLGDRAVVVSDAVAAAGLPEGQHRINGTVYQRKNGAVYLEDGHTLGGSSSNLYDEFHNLLRWGIDESTALRAVSIQPARVVGADKTTGSIAVGKSADLLLADESWHLRAVMVRGVLQDILQNSGTSSCN